MGNVDAEVENIGPVMELIIQFLDVVAWPVTVLVIAFMLRHQLKRLLNRLTEAHIPGFGKLRFDTAALLEVAEGQIERKSAEADHPGDAEPAEIIGVGEREPTLATYQYLASHYSPRIAVMEAWMAVANSIHYVQRRYLPRVRHRDIVSRIGNNDLNSQYVRLMTIRNGVVDKGANIDVGLAESYAKLALQLAKQIRIAGEIAAVPVEPPGDKS